MTVFRLTMLLSFLLAGCATQPLRSSVSANPGGTFWVLVAAEQGIPVSKASARSLARAWSEQAAASCTGAYVGAPVLQITSFAQPGRPFADPYAQGSVVRYTAAFGDVTCSNQFAESIE